MIVYIKFRLGQTSNQLFKRFYTDVGFSVIIYIILIGYKRKELLGANYLIASFTTDIIPLLGL